MGAFKSKAQTKQTEDLTKLKEQLKVIVYDDELVDELAPVIAKLKAVEGFDKVWELVEAKEKQIEALATDGYWSKQASGEDNQHQQHDDAPENKTDDGVNALIQSKYSVEK